MRKHILLGVSAVIVLATGCASMDDTQRRTATGAGIGALAGFYGVPLWLFWPRQRRLLDTAGHLDRTALALCLVFQVQADTLLAAAVGACDGELTLGQIADALAQILEVDADACAEALTAGVRELVWFGMLAPAWR